MSASRYCESNAMTSDPLPIRRSRGMIQSDRPVPGALCPELGGCDWALGTGHWALDTFLVYPQREGGETVRARFRSQAKDAALDPLRHFGIHEFRDIVALVIGRKS